MWGWLGRAFGAVTGRIDDTVRAWVSDLITGVFGYLHSVFSLVGRGWNWFYRNTGGLAVGLNRFMGETFAGFFDIILRIIPHVITWATRWIHWLSRFIESVLHWAAHEFDVIRHWVAALFDAFRRWVINDIWKPLFSNILRIWKWITERGEVLWFYITHPDRLVDLIWENVILKLEHEAWVVGSRLGKFFVSLFLHNLRRFLILMEDILDAVL